MMTGEMNPEGSVRDTIQVSISDDEVAVFGLSIQAARSSCKASGSRETDRQSPDQAWNSWSIRYGSRFQRWLICGSRCTPS